MGRSRPRAWSRLQTASQKPGHTGWLSSAPLRPQAKVRRVSGVRRVTGSAKDDSLLGDLEGVVEFTAPPRPPGWSGDVHAVPAWGKRFGVDMCDDLQVPRFDLTAAS